MTSFKILFIFYVAFCCTNFSSWLISYEIYVSQNDGAIKVSVKCPLKIPLPIKLLEWSVARKTNKEILINKKNNSLAPKDVNSPHSKIKNF